MRRDYEYIVLGLGGLGSAAAYWLARRAGADVLGLEQFELGHVRGESQDHSRIIRLSYHAPNYIALARRAYQCWDELGRDNGEPVVLITGGLDLAPRLSAIPLETYSQSMDLAGVPFETLDADEIMRRWPAFKLTEDIHGLYQPMGGIAMAARGNAAHQRLAQAHGATLKDNTRIESIEPQPDGTFCVNAGGVRYSCRKLVVAAGPWSNSVLANFDCKLPLVVTREQVTYFKSPHLEKFAPDRFPVWIWMDDPCYYGFPVFGEMATKVAQDAGGKPTTADGRDFESDPDNAEGVVRFLERYLPEALGPVHFTKTCLYTLTPDRDFVLDTVPGHAGVSVAIGAGHAYKFASVIGRVLSELAIDGCTPSDIQGFKIDRPVLQLENPPVNYML